MSRLQPLKVLLVEDEKQMAAVIRTIIQTELGWEVVSARDGQEAWEKLEAETYDLIVSDWNMPRKAGDALLHDVRQREDTRHLPFLMVTGHAEHDRVLSAINAGVSDYIVKPFTKKTLLDKIRRLIEEPFLLRPPAHSETARTVSVPPRRENGQAAGTSSQLSPPAGSQRAPVVTASPPANLVKEVVRAFNSGSVDLPLLPQTAFRIVEMVKDEEVDISAVESLLAADTSTTVHLLRFANSSYYSRGLAPIETLKEAIVRLGLKHTLNQVFTLAYRGLFSKQAPLFTDLLARLWEHALATGVCARLLAEHAGVPNAEGCFTLGLLHDIGKLVLADILLALSRARTDIDDAAIQHVFHAVHEEVGAAVLTLWHFPEEFKQIALYHHILSRTDEVNPKLFVVHLANLLVRPLGYSLHPHDGTDLSDLESARFLGLDDASLWAIAAKGQAEIEAMKLLV